MTRNIFGWSYPPGAENDPNAPYNQPDYDDYTIIKTNRSKSVIIEALCVECKDKGVEIPDPKESYDDAEYIDYLLEVLNDEGADPGYKYGIEGEYYSYMIDPDYSEPDYDPYYDED